MCFLGNSSLSSTVIRCGPREFVRDWLIFSYALDLGETKLRGPQPWKPVLLPCPLLRMLFPLAVLLFQLPLLLGWFSPSLPTQSCSFLGLLQSNLRSFSPAIWLQSSMCLLQLSNLDVSSLPLNCVLCHEFSPLPLHRNTYNPSALHFLEGPKVNPTCSFKVALI